MKKIIILLTILSVSMIAWAAPNPKVQIKTNYGEILVELNQAAAPKSVENFLAYARDGFYDGTVFHRVIKGFMVQGGGLTPDMRRKAVRQPVKNEADNGLKNVKGTLALARTGDPHSATSQFFINTANNAFLNHKSKTTRGWGYCVFGKVIKGLNIVESIENVRTMTKAGRRDVPIQPVMIEKITILEEK